MKFATKPIRHHPPHLWHVATLPRKIKNSNFCRYWAGMDFNSSMCITVFWVYLCVFIQIMSLSLNTMLIVDKYCSDVCCDEFPLPQIDRKNTQVKEQWHGKFYLQPVWKTTRYFKHRKYPNLWTNNKIRGNEYAICLHFLTHLLTVCRKFEFLISQGSVVTCLRWGGQCGMGFVANFMRFLAVQKIWKLVKIWRSYRDFKGGNFFWDTV